MCLHVFYIYLNAFAVFVHYSKRFTLKGESPQPPVMYSKL